MGDSGVLDESLGFPPEMRRRGLFSALLDTPEVSSNPDLAGLQSEARRRAGMYGSELSSNPDLAGLQSEARRRARMYDSPEGYMSSDEHQPRLADLMNRGAGAGPVLDPGATAPESTYSAHGRERLVGGGENRIEDDRTRHPYGQQQPQAPPGRAAAQRPATDYEYDYNSPEGIAAAARTYQQMSDPSQRLRDLVAQEQTEYDRLGQPQKPLKLWQKIALGVTAPFGGLGAYVQERDRQQQMREGKRERLLQDMTTGERTLVDEMARTPKPTLEQTAEGRRQLAEEYGLSGEDRQRYILTGQMPVAADKPNLSELSGQRAQIADQYGLQGADRQRYILTGQLPADKPDTSAQEDARMQGLRARQLRGERLTPQESSDLQAYSWRKTLGPQATATAADARLSRQQQFQIDKEARGQVNAAEKQYRQAKESADALGDFINLASKGNKVAGAAVPLEGTLEIVTSQGVKRINRTEVEGIEGAGSLFDRIQARVGKWIKGQPMPPDLLRDFKALNDTMRQNSYRAYSDAYDQAHDTYSAYGTDFGKIKKLAPPLKDQMNSGGPATGMVRFQDSQGGIHDIPRGNLGKARQRDPGLKVLTQ